MSKRPSEEPESAAKRQANEIATTLAFETKNEEEKKSMVALNAYWTVAQEQMEIISDLTLPTSIVFRKAHYSSDRWTVSVSLVPGCDIKFPSPNLNFELGKVKVAALALPDLEAFLNALTGEFRISIIQKIKERIEVWASEVGRAFEVVSDWLAVCQANSLEPLTTPNAKSKAFAVTPLPLLSWTFTGDLIICCKDRNSLASYLEFLDCVIPLTKSLCQNKESIVFT